MNPEQYINEAQMTKSDQYNTGIDPDVVHAIIGISTESGELLDVIKKFMFYGKDIDWVNLDEEIGDVLWYVAIYLKARGLTLEEAMAKNNAKLKARFPDKFSTEKAINRDLETERKILES